MLKILKNILNLLLPPRCKLCGAIVEDDDTLCPDCYNKFDFISQPYCAHCGHPFDEVYQVGKNSSRMLCATCAKDKKPWFRLCRSAYKYQEAVNYLKDMSHICTFSGENAGVHLLVKFCNGLTEEEAVFRAKEAGIKVYGVSEYRIQKLEKEENMVLLGYATMKEEDIEMAMKILKEIWNH